MNHDWLALLCRPFEELSEKLNFCAQITEEKNACFDHQHGCLITWLETKNALRFISQSEINYA